MQNMKCPRCKSEAFEKLKTFCLQCNYINGEDSSDTIIPRWAIQHLALTPEELQDIAEINLGMYRPGYEVVVRFPKEKEETKNSNAKVPVIKKVSRRRNYAKTKSQALYERHCSRTDSETSQLSA